MTLTDLGDAPPDFAEPQRPIHDERVDDRRLPFAGDDAHDRLHALDRIRR